MLYPFNARTKKHIYTSYSDIDDFFFLQMPRKRPIHYRYHDILSLLYNGNIYPCFCTHTVTILCSFVDDVSNDNQYLMFQVLTLNVTIFHFLYLIKLCLVLVSVSDFLKHYSQSPKHSRMHVLFTLTKSDAACRYDLNL